MNDLRKERWLDRAFHAALALLVGLWVLYPPQRIADTQDKPSPGFQAAPSKPALAKTWGLL
jgi:hypothetical protein